MLLINPTSEHKELLTTGDSQRLVSEIALGDTTTRWSKHAAPPPPITAVGVVTHNRPDSLRRCLQSHIENVKAYGRATAFAVMDDSDKPEIRNQIREMLRVLRQAYGVEIAYAGEEEKRRFAAALCDCGDLSTEVIDFALFDSEQYGQTCGANRNALLLHTAGEMFYSTDDDVVCRLAVGPEEKGGGAAASHEAGEMEWWFFPDREAALASARFVSEDLLGIHESLLGKHFIRSQTFRSAQLDSRGRQPSESRAGIIAVTMSGIVGDSGTPLPAAYRRLSPGSRARLASARCGPSGMTSREILRLVPRARIRDKAQYVSGAAVGYDNRQLLPPFMPVGRGQDGVFMQTLRHCFANSYFGDLPWAILHAPMEARAFSSEQIAKTARDIPTSKIIRACVQSLDVGKGFADGPDKLYAVGSHLMEIGSMTLRDFEEFVRIHVRRLQGSYMSFMETYLRAHGESLGSCADELDRYLATMHAALSEETRFVPPELVATRGIEEARQLTQRLVFKFGRLLCEWPSLAQKTKALSNKGMRLAVTV